MHVGILITNPNHHVELTLSVAEELTNLGFKVKYISLCELRRMKTPGDLFSKKGLSFCQMKTLPGNVKPSSGSQSLGSSNSFKRRILRAAFWYLKLRGFIRQSLKGIDKVIVLNDTAFPGNLICDYLKSKHIPFYLIQEGIRFDLPNELQQSYGGGGAEKVFAWGARSKKHFDKVVQSHTKVVISGSSRFNRFLIDVNSRFSDHVGPRKTLGIFTNPIDDQGFCSNDEKLELFESFLMRSATFMNTNAYSLMIKVHPREDINQYLEIAEKYINNVKESPRAILEAILSVDAGVVMASTVGLELLGAERKVGQLEIPGYGYVFDYTENTEVLKIPVSGDFDLEQLFSSAEGSGYFREHIADVDTVDVICQEIAND